MRIWSANSHLSILHRENSAETEKLQIPLTQGVLRRKQKSPNQRSDSDLIKFFALPVISSCGEFWEILFCITFGGVDGRYQSNAQFAA